MLSRGAYILFLAITLVLFPGENEAMANVISLATVKAAATFVNVRSIVYVIGAFGLVGITYFAIFGKMRWAWFAALGFGLFLLSVATGVLDYATGDSMASVLQTSVNKARAGGGGGHGMEGDAVENTTTTTTTDCDFWCEFWQGFSYGFGVGYDLTSSDGRMN